jgi:hypothetical protein
VVFALLLAPVARAQTGQWNPYSTLVYREGPGVRLGSTPLVLHPGLAIEGGYDSNIFYMPQNPVGAGLLRFRAHFDVATLPPQRIEDLGGTADPKFDFRLSTQVEYREYLPRVYAGPAEQQAIQSQRSVNIYLNGDLGILPMGPFTLRINDNYVRTVDPRNLERLPTTASDVSAFSRNYNRAGVLGTYRTPTGRYEIGVGDHVDVNFWDQNDLSQWGDMITNEAEAFFRIRFLPQTSGSINAHVGYTKYFNSAVHESIPVRLTVGASSLITSWVGVGANLGYGGSFHRAAGVTSFNSAVANIEVRFFLPKAIRVAVGYDRDFFDSIISAWYTDDRLYLSFDQPLFRRLSAHLDGGIRFRHYDGLLPPATFGYADFTQDGMSTRSRDDIVYDLHVELSVRATSWLGFSGSYNLVADTSKFAFVLAAIPPAAGESFPASYIKHSGFLRADFAY